MMTDKMTPLSGQALEALVEGFNRTRTRNKLSLAKAKAWEKFKCDFYNHFQEKYYGEKE